MDLLADVAKEGGAAVLRVLAGCQSLVMVDGALVGDPLELAAFNATGAAPPSTGWLQPPPQQRLLRCWRAPALLGYWAPGLGPAAYGIHDANFLRGSCSHGRAAASKVLLRLKPTWLSCHLCT